MTIGSNPEDSVNIQFTGDASGFVDAMGEVAKASNEAAKKVEDNAAKMNAALDSVVKNAEKISIGKKGSTSLGGLKTEELEKMLGKFSEIPQEVNAPIKVIAPETTTDLSKTKAQVDETSASIDKLRANVSKLNQEIQKVYDLLVATGSQTPISQKYASILASSAGVSVLAAKEAIKDYNTVLANTSSSTKQVEVASTSMANTMIDSNNRATESIEKTGEASINAAEKIAEASSGKMQVMNPDFEKAIAEMDGTLEENKKKVQEYVQSIEYAFANLGKSNLNAAAFKEQQQTLLSVEVIARNTGLSINQVELALQSLAAPTSTAKTELKSLFEAAYAGFQAERRLIIEAKTQIIEYQKYIKATKDETLSYAEAAKSLIQNLESQETGDEGDAAERANQIHALGLAERELINEKKAGLAQLKQAEDQYNAEFKQNALIRKQTYTEDVNQIKLVKNEILELARAQNITPVQAAQMPQITGTFNPAVIRAGIEELGPSFDKAGIAKDRFKGNLTGLGGVLQQVGNRLGGFGNLLGAIFAGGTAGIVLSAINLITVGIRNLSAAFEEGVEKAIEYSDAWFKLEVAIREAQRQGMELSRSKVIESMGEFKEALPFYPELQLVKGYGDAILLTKELGITAEDTKKMIDASFTLAITRGRDVADVMRTMALTLSSGYSEGLQRLGLNINKVIITEKAHAMGVKESYMAMSQQARALATLELITEQTAEATADLAAKQKTLAGSIRIANASIEDSSRVIGQAYAPIQEFFLQGWAVLASIFSDAMDSATKSFLMFISIVEAKYETIQTVIKELQSGKSLFDIDIKKIESSIAKQKLYDKIAKYYPQIAGILGDTAVAMETLYGSAELAAKAMDSIEKSFENIEEIVEDYNENVLDAQEDFQEDMAEIDEEGAEKRVEIAEEYAQKLADIEKELQRDIAKENRDYDNDLAKIDSDYESDRLKILEKYKERELELEKEYAEKIAKLRRDLEFDLEEAVRQRDVVQIRRLKRKYNKDLQELAIDYESEKGENSIALQKELDDLAQARLIKRQERAIAHEEKLADLRAQAAIDREEARINYEQELEDLKESLAEQREERIKSYNKQLDDLRKALEKRLRDVAEALAEEINMTIEAATTIYEVMAQIYGENGLMQSVFEYMLAFIQAVKEAAVPIDVDTLKIPDIQTYLNQTSSLPTTSTSTSTSPISYPDSTNSATITVTLSPDLEGRIVENTLTAFSTILERG